MATAANMRPEVNRTLSVCQTPAKTRTVTLSAGLNDFSLLSVSSWLQRLALRPAVCDAIYASHVMTNVERSSKVSRVSKRCLSSLSSL